MHKEIYNKNGNLAHSQECKMIFGKKDPECPRCLEMINGAPARGSWHKEHFEKQAQEIRWLKQHQDNCTCKPLCTYGQW